MLLWKAGPHPSLFGFRLERDLHLARLSSAQTQSARIANPSRKAGVTHFTGRSSRQRPYRYNHCSGSIVFGHRLPPSPCRRELKLTTDESIHTNLSPFYTRAAAYEFISGERAAVRATSERSEFLSCQLGRLRPKRCRALFEMGFGKPVATPWVAVQYVLSPPGICSTAAGDRHWLQVYAAASVAAVTRMISRTRAAASRDKPGVVSPRRRCGRDIRRARRLR